MVQADEHAGLGSAPGGEGRKTWVAAGGVLGAFAASSCCILPLVLFSLGIGGAWIGNLTALAPYQLILVMITLGFLGYGYWLVYRKPKAACADGSACARPLPNRIVKLALWLATALVATAIVFPYVAPTLEQTVTLEVSGMTCASCPYNVRQTLTAVDGVTDVAVSFAEKSAVVTYDDSKTEAAALTLATTNIGFPSSLKE